MHAARINANAEEIQYFVAEQRLKSVGFGLLVLQKLNDGQTKAQIFH